jgi:L,D-peptidoglycan transpeptidase YkuD (ErfK/YbiS/YcfS/YnhG family)
MIVSVTSLVPGRGRLLWMGHAVDCTLGKAGTRVDKREGDGATPIGRYAFRRVLFRADRSEAPRTRLSSAPIAPDDGWCDAAGDAAYNRPVKLPYPASAERLWRDDSLYDIVVVLGHNDDPVVDGAGSAIFMHLKRDDNGPTEGCVGLARADLLELLADLQPGDEIEISAAR